ncbi:complement component C8 gamma chain isoform X2 [Numida meleagris]|uniref:complement component C8 gamma chain isoform X2 n=1 Tax=Numida meleagris TaxID=8996 RepID=UPI000B3DA813|nr:complement component C8 gamma chain isoform X2 [Numida meleagris]
MVLLFRSQHQARRAERSAIAIGRPAPLEQAPPLAVRPHPHVQAPPVGGLPGRGQWVCGISVAALHTTAPWGSEPPTLPQLLTGEAPCSSSPAPSSVPPDLLCRDLVPARLCLATPLPSMGPCCAMAAPRILLLLTLLLSTPWGQGQRPPPLRSPLKEVVTEGNFSLRELVGRWFLVGMASRCSYLAENSHRLEATVMTVAVPDGQSLAISTFRKLDGQCWEIRQRYIPAGAHGRFSVRGRGYNSKMEVMVGETDPRSYAIIYYQDSQGLSVKLYGRSSQLSDAVVDKFEQRARAVGLSEDVTHYFPTYGFCDSADDLHILNETEP